MISSPWHLVVVVRHFRRGRGRVVDGILAGDDEVEGEPLSPRADAYGAAHGDRLAGLEWPRRHEARAVALGIGAQLPGVRARLRAVHVHAGDRAGGRAEHADLRPCRGVVGVGQRGHGERRPGQHRGAVERRRRATPVARCAVRGLLGGDPPRGERERRGAGEDDEHRAPHQEAAQSRHLGETVHGSSHVGSGCTSERAQC
jgi:hypothetical protein